VEWIYGCFNFVFDVNVSANHFIKSFDEFSEFRLFKFVVFSESENAVFDSPPPDAFLNI
jgi:hypothetical protein